MSANWIEMKRRTRLVQACGLIFATLYGPSPVAADECSDFREALAFRDAADIALDRIVPGMSDAYKTTGKFPAELGAAVNVGTKATSSVRDAARAVFLTIDDEPTADVINALLVAKKHMGLAHTAVWDWMNSGQGPRPRALLVLESATDASDALNRVYLESVKAACDER